MRKTKCIDWKEIEGFLKTKYNLKTLNLINHSNYWGKLTRMNTPDFIEGEEDIRGYTI